MPMRSRCSTLLRWAHRALSAPPTRATFGVRTGLLLAAMAAVAMASGVRVWAQDVTETSLKSAFIYNFAKFTNWPDDVLPPSAPLVACVVEDGAVADALERTVKQRLLSGHPVTVSRVTGGSPLRSCHLLYLGRVTRAQAAAVLAVVRGAPVLTIGEVDDFAGIGGIAHMFVHGGKIRFALDLGMAKRVRLQLSSKLLSLATTIHDDTTAAVSR
jgi:hypothetical protein